MIHKSVRIPVDDTQTLVGYFSSHGENEKIRWIMGSPTNMRMAGQVSKIYTRKFSLRHHIISPGEKLDPFQIADAIEEVLAEYGASEDQRERTSVVEHKKRREEGLGWEYHFHLAIPEVDSSDGRVLDKTFFKIRNEKLSRRQELQFGHRITLGKFNRAVYHWIQKHHPEIDISRFRDALIEAQVKAGMTHEESTDRFLEYRATAAYSDGARYAFDRMLKLRAVDGHNVSPLSLSKLCNQIRKIVVEENNDPARFIDRLLALDIRLVQGELEEIWMVNVGGVNLGPISRLTGLDRHALHCAIERVSRSGSDDALAYGGALIFEVKPSAFC